MSQTTKALPFILLIVAGALDYLTTEHLLKDPRFVETRPYYVPFLATVILGAAMLMCMKLGKASPKLALFLIYFMVAVAWTAPLNNLSLIYKY